MSTNNGFMAGGAPGVLSLHPPRPRIAVVALGNPLMGDDGLGLEVLERLRRWQLADTVELVDGGTWGLTLLPILESADHVLLIDAIRGGQRPGTVLMYEGSQVPRCFSVKLSPHQIDMREVLALAAFRGTLPRELVAIGIEPESVELRHALSPVVQSQVAVIEALAIDRLRMWGAWCHQPWHAVA